MILSSCDSQNLNLSPFCYLSSTSLAMWQPRVLETYGNQTTSYVNKIQTPMRLKYPNSMGDEELITSLTKVGLAILTEYYITSKYNPYHLFTSFDMFFVVILHLILHILEIDGLAQFVSILKSKFS